MRCSIVVLQDAELFRLAAAPNHVGACFTTAACMTLACCNLQRSCTTVRCSVCLEVVWHSYCSYSRGDHDGHCVAIGCCQLLAVLKLLQSDLCVQHRRGKDVIDAAAQRSKVAVHGFHKWIQALQDRPPAAHTKTLTVWPPVGGAQSLQDLLKPPAETAEHAASSTHDQGQCIPCCALSAHHHQEQQQQTHLIDGRKHCAHEIRAVQALSKRNLLDLSVQRRKLRQCGHCLPN